MHVPVLMHGVIHAENAGLDACRADLVAFH